MYNIGDNLPEMSEDYTKNVLPHLILDTSQNLNVITGLSSGNFSIEISSDPFQGTKYAPTCNRFVHFTSLRALQSILELLRRKGLIIKGCIFA